MIRARDIIESVNSIVMNERNIANVPELERYIETDLLPCTHIPEVKDWLKKTMRLYLINDFPDIIEVEGTIPGTWTDKDWIKNALSRGEKVYIATPDPHDSQVFAHVIDYVNFALEHTDELPRELQIKKLSALSYDEVYDRTLEWDSWLQGQKGDEGGTEEIMNVGGGYKWVKVLTSSALDYEGSKMGHCVRSYADLVAQNHCTIYSLRDSRNEPHVTIEARRDEVVQIKGKQNKWVVEKYWDYCIDFLNSGRFDVEKIKDLQNINAVVFEGKIYNLDDMPSEWWKSVKWADIWTNRAGYYLYEPISVNIIQKCLDSGADIDQQFESESFKTPLMLLCERKPGVELKPMVNFLLRRGCNIDIQDKDGNTALLHYMSRASNYRDIIKSLLEHGCDVNIRNKKGITALSMYLDKGYGSSEIVEMLLKHGSDPNCSNVFGESMVYLLAEMLSKPDGSGRHDFWVESLLLILRYGGKIRSKKEVKNIYLALKSCKPDDADELKSYLRDSKIDDITY
jgi:hypothetical protein